MANRDELKKALAYLRKKDPENASFQKYDRLLRSYTGADQKKAQGSVELFDYWDKNFSLANREKRQAQSKGMVRDFDGNWESKGYAKEMEKRHENPDDYLNQETVKKQKAQQVSYLDKILDSLGFDIADEKQPALRAEKAGVDTKTVPKWEWEGYIREYELAKKEKAKAEKENKAKQKEATIPTPNYLTGNTASTALERETPTTTKPKNNSQVVIPGMNMKADYEGLDPEVGKQKVFSGMDMKPSDEKPSFWDDIKNDFIMMGQKINPFDDVSWDEAQEIRDSKGATKFQDELKRGTERALDSAALGIVSNLEQQETGEMPEYAKTRELGEDGGVTDMLTTGLGYLAPGSAAYKALNATKAGKALTDMGSRSVLSRLYSEALKGGAIGAGMSTAEVGVREGINPENYNAQQNLEYIGMNTALGAVADPVLYGLGKGIKAGAQNIAGRMAKVDGELPAYTGNVSEGAANSMKPNNRTPEQILQELTGTSKPNALYDHLLDPKTPKVREIDEKVVEIQNQKQAAEDAFVEQELAPYRQMDEQVKQNQQAKEEAVARAQSVLDDIRAKYNRVVSYNPQQSVLVPQELRSGSGQSVDIATFAQQEGFQNVNDALRFLQEVDATAKMDLESIPDSAALDEKALKKIEDEARKAFQTSPNGKVFEDAIANLGKNRDEILNPKELKVNNGQKKRKTQESITTDDMRADDLIEQTFSKNVNNSQTNLNSPPDFSEDGLESLMKELDNITQSSSVKKNITEDEFVAQELAPYLESQKAHAEAEAVWRDIVKVSKEEAKEIKQTFGKIVPDGKSKDLINDVPPQFRGKKGGKGDDIYKFADTYGFRSADEAVDYLKELDKNSKLKLKDLYEDDGLKISENQFKELEIAARKSFRENNPQPEDILEELAKPNDPSKLFMNLDGTLNNAPSKPSTPEVEAPKNDNGSKFLMRLDSQQHAPTNGSTLVETEAPVTTTSPIDMQKNWFKRKYGTFYQKYFNRNHHAKVAEVQILKNAGQHDLAKKVQRYGSDFDKATGNELAAGSAAKNLLDRHFSSLEEAVKPIGKDTSKNLAEMMDIQLAHNLDWIKQNVDPAYELPNGWDWGRVNGLINRAINNTNFDNFKTAMYNLNQEVRDVMLNYGMITKEVHELLGQNPYYTPMARDISQLLDNIDVGMSQRIGNRRRGAGPGILYSLKGGDVDTFIKNPLDTLVERTFTMYQNAMRNDTALQALRLAEIDNGSLGLVKEITPRQYKEGGGLMVLQDGKKRYIRLQKDLQTMLDENQSVLDLGKLGKATQIFAGLKTRSLEYQSAAIVRDLGQAYLTSQIRNPVRYTMEFFRSLGQKSMSAKEAGAYFDRAYNDHTGGVDPKRLLAEYQKRTGNVRSFKVNDKESWKGLGNAIKRTIDKVDLARKLGQITDEIPRDIEVRETRRLFMKKHGATINNLESQLSTLNQQIAQAQNAPAFSPQTQGIDVLIQQRDGIESQLRQIMQNLRREQIYRGRDVIDYSRMGGGKTMSKVIRPWIVFANTTVQSKDKVIRSFIERPGSTTAKMVGLLGPMVALQQMNFDSMDEQEKAVYDGLPDYMKQFNYIFVNGGDVYAVPKLHELALVSNPIEAALKGESQDDAMRLLVKELIPYQGGMFAQGLVSNADGSITPTQNMQVPSMVGSPVVDAIANKKLGFNQKPISFGGYYQGADTPANDWTLDVFKDLMGDNPGADKAQYITQQYGGDYGKYATYGLDALMDPSNGDKLDEMLRYLNPLQDRIYKEDSKFFRSPPAETKK